jgi:hypothetical protein
MSKLFPWLELKTMKPINIGVLDLDEVPEKPGVYIMLSDHVKYSYPWSEYESHGDSQVYYIGQSHNLRERLTLHKSACEDVVRAKKEKPDKDLGYYRRYEYAAWHGCNIVWLVSQNPNGKETEIMEEFRRYYGAKPVANG